MVLWGLVALLSGVLVLLEFGSRPGTCVVFRVSGFGV